MRWWISREGLHGRTFLSGKMWLMGKELLEVQPTKDMSYYQPSWRALQIKCAWRWRMLDQSLLIGPRWQLSRALRSGEEGIPGVGIAEGGMEEWEEGVKNNFGVEGSEGENDSNIKEGDVVCRDIHMAKGCLRDWKYGEIWCIWPGEGLCSQPMVREPFLDQHGGHGCWAPAQVSPSAAMGRAEESVQGTSWEIKQCQEEDTGIGLKSH